MNDTPPTSETSEAVPSVAADEAVKPKPGALSERHHRYAEEFKQWLLGLNRHDFGQVKRVLETMTRAYFKHTVKVHSPPMRDKHNDDSGKTSDGIPDSILPSPDGAQ
jgi:hypothetical protein